MAVQELDRGIETAAIGALRTRFRGALLCPGEEGYEEARRPGR